MRLVDTRNEQTAAYIAESSRRLTGRPGLCAVSSGVAQVDALTGRTQSEKNCPTRGQQSRPVTVSVCGNVSKRLHTHRSSGCWCSERTYLRSKMSRRSIFSPFEFTPV